MVDLCDVLPDDPNWKHLRFIAADPGPGAFVDETDWAGGATLPPVEDRISVPSADDSQATDLGTLVVEFLLTTANAAAVVPRGTMSFDVQIIEAVGREHIKCRARTTALIKPPDHAIDTIPLTGVPPQRKVYIQVRGSNWVAIRLSNFANVPGTAAELHILYRLE